MVELSAQLTADASARSRDQDPLALDVPGDAAQIGVELPPTEEIFFRHVLDVTGLELLAEQRTQRSEHFDLQRRFALLRLFEETMHQLRGHIGDRHQQRRSVMIPRHEGDVAKRSQNRNTTHLEAPFARVVVDQADRHIWRALGIKEFVDDATSAVPGSEDQQANGRIRFRTAAERGDGTPDVADAHHEHNRDERTHHESGHWRPRGVDAVHARPEDSSPQRHAQQQRHLVEAPVSPTIAVQAGNDAEGELRNAAEQHGSGDHQVLKAGPHHRIANLRGDRDRNGPRDHIERDSRWRQGRHQGGGYRPSQDSSKHRSRSARNH